LHRYVADLTEVKTLKLAQYGSVNCNYAVGLCTLESS
jgi:hypothetical protein